MTGSSDTQANDPALSEMSNPITEDYKRELANRKLEERQRSPTHTYGKFETQTNGLLSKIFGRWEALTSSESTTIKTIAYSCCAVAGLAGTIVVLKRVGLISRIRNTSQLPIASVASHETIPGIVTTIESPNIFHVKHAPLAYSLVVDTNKLVGDDKDTLRVRLAGIDSMSKERTEFHLPPGKQVSIQLVGKSIEDHDVVTGLVWPRYRPFASSINLKLISEGYAKVCKVDNRILKLHFPSVYGQMCRSMTIAQLMRRGKWDEVTKPGLGWQLVRGLGFIFSTLSGLIRRSRA
eukprot:CAMPEP_0114517656 /NCGR_PEP_ID=MMETSP0109-20121206/18013_1 /TAXON_ID=29199 /ORGANISM="Chlorarachnion reptans, Strain CCCM449" /LENGTH=292 /DNA_ID=CAMNT_0001698197 /DNA_START=125 /DNA_END=1003 /DNA_ORIENTATION=+